MKFISINYLTFARTTTPLIRIRIDRALSVYSIQFNLFIT